MKRNFTLLLVLMLAFSMTLLISCKNEEAPDSSASNDIVDDETDDNNNYIEDEMMNGSFDEVESKGITYDEEQEGAKLQKIPSNVSMYIGSWTAPSDMARFLYGNVDLTVKEDGTWRANITDENLSGKWTDEGDHLHMQNTMFSFDLAFNTSGKLILIEKNSDGDLYTVLVRK